jgi:hypothetical protein
MNCGKAFFLSFHGALRFRCSHYQTTGSERKPHKTGTLTFGTPQIREVVSADGFGEQQVIAAASIAERKSEHPLARQ